MASAQEPAGVPSELQGLLPAPRSDARVVLYLTEPMKAWFNSVVDAVIDAHPKAPKNVVYQIAMFVLGNHWSEVQDLVARWDRGEVLSLRYAPPPSAKPGPERPSVE